MMIKFSLVLFLSPYLPSFFRLQHMQTHYDGQLDAVSKNNRDTLHVFQKLWKSFIKGC